ncbi:SCO6745 family protein [Streptomyces decoyicus]
MTSLPERAGRHCHFYLNSLHSTVYFTPYLENYLSEYGIDDPMAVYLASRAAPLGAASPGAITAIFNGLAYDLIASHFPGLWRRASPDAVLTARKRAADATLRQLFDARTLVSREMAQAAQLALRATEACDRAGRPLFSAHADLPVPDEPHLALWHAATLLREYRGDGHFAVLSEVGLAGLDGLVSHCASPEGMPRQFVMAKRGWTAEDWAAAEQRLRERGLMDEAGALTVSGLRLREDIEKMTDHLDRAPYANLGTEGVARLTELSREFVVAAADTGVFPAPLRPVFTDAR